MLCDIGRTTYMVIAKVATVEFFGRPAMPAERTLIGEVRNVALSVANSWCKSMGTSCLASISISELASIDSESGEYLKRGEEKNCGYGHRKVESNVGNKGLPSQQAGTRKVVTGNDMVLAGKASKLCSIASMITFRMR